MPKTKKRGFGTIEMTEIPENKRLGRNTLKKSRIPIYRMRVKKSVCRKKKRQNCKIIALSPIFYNPKFSNYKTLGATRFNLISRIWSADLCALGGINEKNFKKIYFTKATSIAFQRFIT